MVAKENKESGLEIFKAHKIWYGTGFISLVGGLILIIGIISQNVWLEFVGLIIAYGSLVILFFLMAFARLSQFQRAVDIGAKHLGELKKDILTFSGITLLGWIMTVIFFSMFYVYFGRLGYNVIRFSNNMPIPPLDSINFYFSIVTLTSLGYGDFHPVGVGRYVAMFEVFAGYILLGVTISMVAIILNGTTKIYGEELEKREKLPPFY